MWLNGKKQCRKSIATKRKHLIMIILMFYVALNVDVRQGGDVSGAGKLLLKFED